MSAPQSRERIQTGYFLPRFGAFFASFLIGDFLAFLSGGHLARFLTDSFFTGVLVVLFLEVFLFDRITLSSC